MKIEDVDHVWEAYAAPGKPLCIAGTGEVSGMSVEIYFTKKGKIKGVAVYDRAEEKHVAVAGKVPKIKA